MGCVRGVVEGVQSTCTDAKVRDRVGEEMQYLVGESMGEEESGSELGSNFDLGDIDGDIDGHIDGGIDMGTAAVDGS